MSGSGSPDQSAENSSGCCVNDAPMSSPPLERPEIAKCCGDVYFCAIRYSAAANQSSNTFCLCSNMPASCQASPYSPPPRRLGTASQPPCSSHQAHAGFHSGVMLTLKPP